MGRHLRVLTATAALVGAVPVPSVGTIAVSVVQENVAVAVGPQGNSTGLF
jgi:hypothetical protein